MSDRPYPGGLTREELGKIVHEAYAKAQGQVAHVWVSVLWDQLDPAARKIRCRVGEAVQRKIEEERTDH